MLDLEVAGEVRELTLAEVDAAPAKERHVVKKLRDSHHAVARLVAAGLRDVQIALSTGYTTQRIRDLRDDPSFIELVTYYQHNEEQVRVIAEERFRYLMEDSRQELHERLHDDPKSFTHMEILKMTEMAAAHAGLSPIQRSMSKNVNYNVGDLLDAANKRRKEVA